MTFPPRFRRKIDRPLSHRPPKLIGMPAWLLMAAAPLPRKIQDTEGVEGKSNCAARAPANSASWSLACWLPLLPELSHNRTMVTLAALRTGQRNESLRRAQQRGARNLRVFGSVARDEANESSDLDLLVEWEPGRSLLDHAGLVEDLQELLGMKVHVGTEKSLHWYVRDRILREATPL